MARVEEHAVDRLVVVHGNGDRSLRQIGGTHNRGSHLALDRSQAVIRQPSGIARLGDGCRLRPGSAGERELELTVEAIGLSSQAVRRRDTARTGCDGCGERPAVAVGEERSGDGRPDLLLHDDLPAALRSRDLPQLRTKAGEIGGVVVRPFRRSTDCCKIPFRVAFDPDPDADHARCTCHRLDGVGGVDSLLDVPGLHRAAGASAPVERGIPVRQDENGIDLLAVRRDLIQPGIPVGSSPVAVVGLAQAIDRGIHGSGVSHRPDRSQTESGAAWGVGVESEDRDPRGSAGQ